MKIRFLRIASSVLVSVRFLAACDGDGGSGRTDGGSPDPVTYSVGGTVTGLTASGLKIRSGTTDLDIAAVGAFTFPVKLASGIAYSVTIVSQPAAQVCTVTGGSGTVGASNVTNVAITCTTSTPPATHTVGGVLSGLAGSGLKLNDGIDDLAISADGAFTFPTALAEGAQYNVTVVVQPSAPAQVCSVSQGSGAVGTSDVIAVAVACTTPPDGGGGGATTYSVGGTISGLTGTTALGAQVTLSNGTVESLNVGANGAFTFPTSLASGAEYHVTVAAQPTEPHQVCTVSNGDGTVGTANVTDLTIACQTSPLTFVSTPANGTVGILRTVIPTLTFSTFLVPSSVTSATITLDSAAGTTPITVTMQGPQTVVVTPTSTLLPSTLYTILVKRSVRSPYGEKLVANTAVTFTTTAAGWTDVKPIESSDEDATAPRIATDGDGNAIAVWAQKAGGVANIYTSRYTPADGWGMPVPIQTDPGQGSSAPQIAVAKMFGNAIAVWLRKNSAGSTEVWANCYSPTAGGWGTAKMVSQPGFSASALNPQVVVFPGGDGTVVWVQSGKVRINQYLVAPDLWTTSLLVGEGISATAMGSPQIAYDAHGNQMVVWQAFDGVQRIWSQYNSNAPELVDSTATTRASDPQLAFDPTGAAVVVWTQARGSLLDIRSNRYAPGTGWGTSLRIDDEDDTIGPSPTLAIDTAGNAVAMWKRFDGMKANSYAAGVNWGTVTSIGIDPFGGSDAVPRVAFDARGNALAVWAMSDGTRYNIWSNNYTAPANGNGGGWGVAALVEHDNTGDALVPDIAINSLGQGFAIWQQFDGMRNNIVESAFQ